VLVCRLARLSHLTRSAASLPGSRKELVMFALIQMASRLPSAPTHAMMAQPERKIAVVSRSVGFGANTAVHAVAKAAAVLCVFAAAIRLVAIIVQGVVRLTREACDHLMREMYRNALLGESASTNTESVLEIPC
jgi:hypothetical protein